MAKVYYFPETANAYRIAKKISQKIPDCELIEITQNSSYNLTCDDDVVGIVFPVFYYGFSETVDTFMKNFQITNKTYLFVTITRGVYLPGRVKKQLLNKFQTHVSCFQYITMGDSFNLDFWNYSSAQDKKLRNKQFDISANKIAQSIRSRVIKKPYALMDFISLIKNCFSGNDYQP